MLLSFELVSPSAKLFFRQVFFWLGRCFWPCLDTQKIFPFLISCPWNIWPNTVWLLNQTVRGGGPILLKNSSASWVKTKQNKLRLSQSGWILVSLHKQCCHKGKTPPLPGSTTKSDHRKRNSCLHAAQYIFPYWIFKVEVCLSPQFGLSGLNLGSTADTRLRRHLRFISVVFCVLLSCLFNVVDKILALFSCTEAE